MFIGTWYDSFSSECCYKKTEISAQVLRSRLCTAVEADPYLGSINLNGINCTVLAKEARQQWEEEEG